MSSIISSQKTPPPWPPTTHEFLAIKIACRQLGVRAAVTEMEIQSVMDDISKAPPTPAPAARDNRYVAFTEYVKDRHCWMDAWIDIWLVDYWWAWELLNGYLEAPNAYFQPDSASVVRRSGIGSIYSGLEMWM